MGHTPFGYRIENGIAVVDEPAAAKIRQLYQNYLDGLSLSKAAAEAGIKTYHGTAKRLMQIYETGPEIVSKIAGGQHPEDGNAYK